MSHRDLTKLAKEFSHVKPQFVSALIVIDVESEQDSAYHEDTVGKKPGVEDLLLLSKTWNATSGHTHREPGKLKNTIARG